MAGEEAVSIKFEISDFDIVQMLAALGDPVRFEIFLTLRGSFGLSAGQLGNGRLSAPTMSHHLNKMVNAGPLGRTAYGRHRFYSINPKAMAALGRWYFDTTIFRDRLYDHVKILSSALDNALTAEP